MPVEDELVGVVLTGGESKRMGHPKALLPYKGMPLFYHLAKMLQNVFTNVVLSHRKDRFEIPFDEWPVIEDSADLGGPLTGLLSTLENLNNPVLCIPCDTPFMDETTIRYLVEKRDKNQFCTVFYNQENGFYEPLIGIWELSAIPVLRDNLSRGQFSFQKILREHHIRKIRPPDMSALQNINTMPEWEAL